MKKILFLFFACMLLTGTVTAQTVEKSEKTHQQVVVDSILKVVESIKTLQEESKADRDRVWKEKKKHRAKSEGENSENVPTQYGAMLQIEKNTHQNWCSDGWNFFGIATILVAIISAIYTIVTYRAQHKTEKHTTNAPIDVQLWKLKDLPRHFYRNLVCTGAIIYRYKYNNGEKLPKAYPSESHLLKLEVMPDDILLPIDVDTKNKAENNYYKHMHETKLLLRNYNIEVRVALEHLKRQTISSETVRQDIDNLLFKPIFLTLNTFDFEKALPGAGSESLVRRTIVTFIEEHFKKMQDNFNELLKPSSIACIDMIRENSYQESIDFSDSIKRSLNMLIKYGKKEGRVQDMVFNDETGQASISADAINNEFSTELLKINNKEGFVDFYRNKFDKAEKPANQHDIEQLYERMTPYITFMKQERWDLYALLTHMLTIDIAIEIDRIGMVNFD